MKYKSHKAALIGTVDEMIRKTGSFGPIHLSVDKEAKDMTPDECADYLNRLYEVYADAINRYIEQQNDEKAASYELGWEDGNKHATKYIKATKKHKGPHSLLDYPDYIKKRRAEGLTEKQIADELGIAVCDLRLRKAYGNARRKLKDIL